MAKATRKIKLSKNLRPFVSRVVTSGAVQKAFAEQIGKPVGACVRAGVHEGMSGAAIRKVVKDCAKAVKGTSLSFPGKGTRKRKGK